MTDIETAFDTFDTAFANYEYDREVYDGETEDHSDESDADKKRELVASLRKLANAASELATSLDAETV